MLLLRCKHRLNSFSAYAIFLKEKWWHENGNDDAYNDFSAGAGVGVADDDDDDDDDDDYGDDADDDDGV